MSDQMILYLDFWKPILLVFFTTIGFGLYCWKKSDEYRIREKEMFRVPQQNITHNYHFYGNTSAEQMKMLDQVQNLPAPAASLTNLNNQVVKSDLAVLEGEQGTSHEIPVTLSEVDMEKLKKHVEKPQQKLELVDLSDSPEVEALYHHLAVTPKAELESQEIQKQKGDTTVSVHDSFIPAVENHGAVLLEGHSEENNDSNFLSLYSIEERMEEPRVDPFEGDYVEPSAQIKEMIIHEFEGSPTTWWGLSELETQQDIGEDSLTISRIERLSEDHVQTSLPVIGKITGHHQDKQRYAIKFSDPEMTSWVEVSKEVYQYPLHSILMLHLFGKEGVEKHQYSLDLEKDFYLIHSPDQQGDRQAI